MAFFLLPTKALNEFFKVVQAFVSFLSAVIFASKSHDVFKSAASVVPDLLLDGPSVNDIPRLNRELLVVISTDLAKAWLRCVRFWK
jgi:hypothetical protein